MPSPLAHMAAGYAMYRVFDPRLPKHAPELSERVPLLMLAALGLSLLPDVDSVAGILLGDFGRFHNGWTHSLFIGLGVALVVGSFAWFKQRRKAKAWFLITLSCYGLHVVMDYSAVVRGVILFWPLTLARFQAPVRLFYGLHWSDGFVSLRHVWTLLSELALIALVMLAMRILERYVGRFRSAPRTLDQSANGACEEGR